MADENETAELPRRVPGTARAVPLSPVSSVVPTLSEELRQRMQAAIKAERTGAAVHEREHAAGDQTTELPWHMRPPNSVVRKEAGPETSSPANGTSRKLRVPAAVEPAARLAPVVRAQAPVELRSGVRSELEKPRRRAGTRLVALGLVIIVMGSLAAVWVKHLFGALATEAAVRAQAAAWIAEQVSPDVTVSCDAVTCAALKADGFPAGKLVVLGPTSPVPAPSVLVVETATVRDLFGSSLAIAWAPAVLASFGSGTSAIAVRVVAPHGAAAYQTLLNAGLADRRTAGAALLNDSHVTVSATASSQLMSGQVDSRLLLALTSVARHQPIDIVRFGNIGPGASPGVPLRFADLAESVPAAHIDGAAYIRAVWTVLSGADARIRPARAISGPVQGQPILRVEFIAPSPLGELGSGSS